MKKMIAWIMALMMVFSCAAVIAENVQEPLVGVWYVNQIIMDGLAYNLNNTENPDQMVIEFKDDMTGYIYHESTSDSKANIAWKKDEDGNYWYMEESNPVAAPVKIEDGYIVVGTETVAFILNKEPIKPVEFAQTVKATKASEFNGKYALTYLAGDGYAMKAENAMEDLAALGIKNTGIQISDSNDTSALVEFFGNDPRTYLLNADEGTLDMKADANLEFLNVHMFKTADGGLAINWLDLTFYCDPVTE